MTFDIGGGGGVVEWSSSWGLRDFGTFREKKMEVFLFDCLIVFELLGISVLVQGKIHWKKKNKIKWTTSMCQSLKKDVLLYIAFWFFPFVWFLTFGNWMWPSFLPTFALPAAFPILHRLWSPLLDTVLFLWNGAPSKDNTAPYLEYWSRGKHDSKPPGISSFDLSFPFEHESPKDELSFDDLEYASLACYCRL